MQNDTLKLIYPQWQGGQIAHWFKDLEPREATLGYYLGAQILNLLVDSITPNYTNTAIVPICLDCAFTQEGGRIVQDGIIDKKILQQQTKAAFEILSANNPNKILTLGGECSTSIAPFTYLAHKYKNEVAMIWLDAHPDLGLPYDEFYQGYHAMAVSAILGKGGLKEDFGLPSVLDSNKILLVGLHSDEAEYYATRQKEFGLQSLAPKEIAQDSTKILQWLKNSRANKVLIHLDLDVLDPQELYVAVGNTGVMKIDEITMICDKIASNYEVVGFTIAEHLPKAQIKLKSLLQRLPLAGR